MVTDISKEEPIPENGPKAANGNQDQDPLAVALAKNKEWEEKAQESEKKYLYLYSEFENFRRRNERERSDFLKFGHEGFIRDLLQVLDNFERAMLHAKSFHPEKNSPLDQLNQGVHMIHHQMVDTLKSQGVAPIHVSAGTKFDPALHEAVGEEENDTMEPGSIVKEALKGYLLHGRLLRAAKVVTSKKKL